MTRRSGFLANVQDRDGLVQRIRTVLDTARSVGVPVLYVRHVSVPPTHMGVGALRTAMAWQCVDQADAVTSAFPPDAPHSQLVHELAPAAGEPVFDKLGMSALVGTPLEAGLCARAITTLVLVGAVLEIGIEPTARHAADLGFLPVVVADAWVSSTLKPPSGSSPALPTRSCPTVAPPVTWWSLCLTVIYNFSRRLCYISVTGTLRTDVLERKGGAGGRAAVGDSG